MNTKGIVKLLTALLLASAGANVAYAQVTAQIVGTITDSSGAVIPGVTVTVVNVDTGLQREVTTDQVGSYTVPLLQAGNYRIEVQKNGFKSATRAGISLDVAQTAQLDFALEVGSSVQTISVTDTTPLLDTQSNAIGGVVTPDKFQELPMKGRNSNGFMELVPGVRVTQATTNGPILESHYQFFSVNGSRPNQNQFQLDGGNDTDLAFNAPEYSAQVDSVQEYRVQTNNFSAEYAGTAGAVINVVTKGGTNQFHGDLFEYVRNDALGATNFFTNKAHQTKPSLRYNQFGGTVGGPIIKNRTFFFFGYEGLRYENPVVTTTSVPTALERAGNFSQLLAANGQPVVIYDPLTTVANPNSPGNYIRTAFTNNTIPQNRLDPVAGAIEAYFPTANTAGAANTGLNNFVFSGFQTQPVNDLSLRLDHQLKPRTMVTFRFSESRVVITIPPTFGLHDIASPGYSATHEWHPSGLFKVSETFSPTFYGEFVATWNRFWFYRVGLSNGFNPTQLGFPSYLAASANALGFPLGFPSISPGEMSGLGSYISAHDIGDRGELKANLTKMAGKHTLKFGGVYDLGRYNFHQHNNAVGTYASTAAFAQGPNPLVTSTTAGDGFASFLLGTMSAATQNPTDFDSLTHETWLGFYFQDNYKVTPRLTLNLGIRYDNELPRTEATNRVDNFNYTGTATLSNGVLIHGGLEYPGYNGLPRGNWQDNPLNFGPRIGFAYNLGKATVLRGGYGLFYANSWGSGRNGGFMEQDGYTCSTTAPTTLNGGLTPYAYLSSPFPTGLCTAPGPTAGLLANLGTSASFIDRDEQVPYGESWNFDIQRDLPGHFVLETSYSGSRGINLIGQLNWDQLAPQYMSMGTQLNNQVANPYYGVITGGSLATSTITLGQSLRPYPQFASLTSNNATYGDSVYHGMFVRVERRFSKGFSFMTAYTIGKLIDNVEASPTGFPGEDFATAVPENYYNLKSERALASWDTPQSLVLNYTYELPVGPGKPFVNQGGALGRIIGGWQLSGITIFQSGPPLYITGGNSPGAFAGTTRPNWSGKNPTLHGSIAGRLSEFFDITQFSNNSPYTFGDAPRLMPDLRGPGAKNFDISLFKNTQINDRFRLQLHADAFNAFNRVQFGLPATGFGSNTFGVISSQLNSPRDIQLGLKLYF